MSQGLQGRAWALQGPGCVPGSGSGLHSRCSAAAGAKVGGPGAHARTGHSSSSGCPAPRVARKLTVVPFPVLNATTGWWCSSGCLQPCHFRELHSHKRLPLPPQRDRQVVLKRLFMSKTNRPPLSLSKLAKFMAGKVRHNIVNKLAMQYALFFFFCPSPSSPSSRPARCGATQVQTQNACACLPSGRGSACCAGCPACLHVPAAGHPRQEGVVQQEGVAVEQAGSGVAGGQAGGLARRDRERRAAQHAQHALAAAAQQHGARSSARWHGDDSSSSSSGALPCGAGTSNAGRSHASAHAAAAAPQQSNLSAVVVRPPAVTAPLTIQHPQPVNSPTARSNL